MAKIYKLTITVYTTPMEFHTPYECGNKQVKLWYSGDKDAGHYDLLLDADTNPLPEPGLKQTRSTSQFQPHIDVQDAKTMKLLLQRVATRQWESITRPQYDVILRMLINIAMIGDNFRVWNNHSWNEYTKSIYKDKPTLPMQQHVRITAWLLRMSWWTRYKKDIYHIFRAYETSTQEKWEIPEYLQPERDGLNVLDQGPPRWLPQIYQEAYNKHNQANYTIPPKKVDKMFLDTVHEHRDKYGATNYTTQQYATAWQAHHLYSTLPLVTHTYPPPENTKQWEVNMTVPVDTGSTKKIKECRCVTYNCQSLSRVGRLTMVLGLCAKAGAHVVCLQGTGLKQTHTALHQFQCGDYWCHSHGYTMKTQKAAGVMTCFHKKNLSKQTCTLDKLPNTKRDTRKVFCTSGQVQRS